MFVKKIIDKYLNVHINAKYKNFNSHPYEKGMSGICHQKCPGISRNVRKMSIFWPKKWSNLLSGFFLMIWISGEYPEYVGIFFFDFFQYGKCPEYVWIFSVFSNTENVRNTYEFFNFFNTENVWNTYEFFNFSIRKMSGIRMNHGKL